MKKIDLNIKIDDLDFGEQIEQFKGKKGFEISKDYIIMAFNLYQTQPDQRTGQPRGMPISEQRKIYKLLDELDKMKKGILELEDDRYDFLKKIFDEVNWIGGTKIVVRIADNIDEVGIEKEKVEEVKEKEETEKK